MLAYAASRPQIASRRPSPNAMLAIIAGHVALIALVMSAKMEIERNRPPPPLIIDTIPVPKPPPPEATVPNNPRPQPLPTTLTQPDPVLPLPLPQDPVVPTGPTTPGPGPIAMGGGTGIPQLPPVTHNPVKLGPRLATPSSELKPPYPASKIASEEEAVLRLRLTIDANGRVVAVDSVGPADRAFLDAARRHLIAHWRYKPASEGGRAIASSTVITLRFELDG
jgi:periplasmic protein TonB